MNIQNIQVAWYRRRLAPWRPIRSVLLEDHWVEYSWAWFKLVIAK